jgi:hypothetical protein
MSNFWAMAAGRLLLLCLVGYSEAVNVLVFGDSQGDTGPTWKALQDVLDKHKSNATVINKSVGGTRACGWASDPDAIVKAAQVPTSCRV